MNKKVIMIDIHCNLYMQLICVFICGMIVVLVTLHRII